MLKELLGNSEKLESQANQAAVNDSKGFKVFNYRNSLHRHPADNFESVQKNLNDSKIIQKNQKESKRFQMILKRFQKSPKIPKDSKRF